MTEKKAFILDTNFIKQTKDLDEVIANLSDRFSVYVTQVSVDERIAQECRKVKARHKELDEIKKRFADIAQIKTLKTCEKEQETYRTGMQKKYKEAFKERLIPFLKDGVMLSAVLERAYSKTPPFSSEDHASDKGFKDALIWESLLVFFKEKGENEVLLITDDGGFTKNADDLCAEFAEVTGKKLFIHPNSYYRELLKPELVDEPKQPPQILNVEVLRQRIQEMLKKLCYAQSEDYWGNEVSEETFILRSKVDSTYVKTVFDNIEKVRLDYLFDVEIPASAILDLDDRITDTKCRIPMTAIDDIVKLYEEIKAQYPDYIEQFVLAAVHAINGHYHEQSKADYSDDELPF